MTEATPYTIPKEPGRWRALTFAALVHAGLLAFLWIGIRWQNETPATIEAEVWSPQVREAAPQPEPVKAPEPQPEPKPVISEPPKPKVEETPPLPKPDIALEQEKKRKLLEQKKREEEERERQAKEKKRIEDEKLAKEKEKKRAEEEKLAQLKLEKEKADKEKAKKEAAEKKRKQDEADAKLAKLRDEEMRRMMNGVTGTGGSGDAEKSQGGRASAAYAGKIAAKIRSNTVYAVPEGVAGNPPVEYDVSLLPDGTLRGTPRKVKSSGIAGFDEAVLRAIEKSQPFPRDDRSGTVPSSVTISHRPKDQ